MAKDKNSFILYTEYEEVFEELSDEDAGQLVKHLFRYVNDKKPVTNNPLVRLSFIPIKKRLKRDLIRWENEMAKKSEGGRIGNLKRWHPELHDDFLENKITLDRAEEIVKEQKESDSDSERSDSDGKGSDAIGSVAVTVTVPVTVTEPVPVTVPEKKKNKPINTVVYSKEVHDCYDDCIVFFDESLYPKTDSLKNNWLDTIDKLNRIEKIPFNGIVRITQVVRNDNFWSKNFQSITKLRKKNDEGNLYVVSLYNKFKDQINGQSSEQDRLIREAIEEGIFS